MSMFSNSHGKRQAKVRACSFHLSTSAELGRMKAEIGIIKTNEHAFYAFWRDKSIAKALSLPTSVEHIPLLTFILDCACELETFFPSLTINSVSAERPITLTQRQALTLVACAILDVLPSPPVGFDAQCFTFNDFHNTELLKCVAQYLATCKQRVDADANWAGTLLTFSRRAVGDGGPGAQPDSAEAWAALTCPLVAMEVFEEGDIAFTQGTLQADFANEHIGGGVLHGGCVQEEIRFVLSPECLVSLLLCDRMSCDEAILIRGTETFSRYSGYNGSFRFAGPYADSAPVKYTSANTSSNVSGSGPGLGHRESLLVAFDATRFALGKQALSQFNTNAVLRDLRKCYAAVACWEGQEESIDAGEKEAAIATALGSLDASDADADADATAAITASDADTGAGASLASFGSTISRFLFSSPPASPAPHSSSATPGAAASFCSSSNANVSGGGRGVSGVSGVSGSGSGGSSSNANNSAKASTDIRTTAGLRPFATGKWGCGAFGGDPQLKAVEQWLACSVVGRRMAFYAFGDDVLSRGLRKVVTALLGRQVSVGTLAGWTFDYKEACLSRSFTGQAGSKQGRQGRRRDAGEDASTFFEYLESRLQQHSKGQASV